MHQSFKKILDNFNAEANSSATEAEIEAIISKHIENALVNAGREIEALFEMKNVVLSVQIHEVCVYSQPSEGEENE